LKDDIVEESFITDVIFANSIHMVVSILASFKTNSVIVIVIGLDKVPVVFIKNLNVISVVSAFCYNHSLVSFSSSHNEEHGYNSLGVWDIFHHAFIGSAFFYEFSGGKSDFLLSDEDFA